MGKIKMRLSFTGVFRNAMEAAGQIREYTDDCLKYGDLDEDEHADACNRIGNIETCLSAYHDTILAILKGDVTFEDARDFLCLEGDALAAAKYDASIVTIKNT